MQTPKRSRLEELEGYYILDTPPEKEFDDMVEIASAICDTPVSMVSLLDDHRQWFKAKKGVEATEAPREISFCQYALENPGEVLVVDDPLNDDRFRDNPFVVDDPHVRFYAGAPLATASGNVLGTLCVIDDKPRTITESQIKALQLLARKTVEQLDARKILIDQRRTIDLNATRLKKLTDLVPGAIFQFEMSAAGEMEFTFVSKGISKMHEEFTPERVKKDVGLAFSVVHPDDLADLQASIQESFQSVTLWQKEFRVMRENGRIDWFLGTSQPEKMEDGRVVWYGSFLSISHQKHYEKILEEISFDISHVLRKPVAKILGLTSLIEEDAIDGDQLKEVIGHLRDVSKELNKFTHRLTDHYHQKKQRFQ